MDVLRPRVQRIEPQPVVVVEDPLHGGGDAGADEILDRTPGGDVVGRFSS